MLLPFKIQMASAAKDQTVTVDPAPQNQATAAYSAGAATPFAVPPPSSYSSFYQGPIHFIHPHPPRPSTPIFLCRFLTGAVIVCVIFAVVTTITWLAVKPHFPTFRVDSATVSSLNATGTELTAQFNIALFVRNPNRKLSISYNSIDAEVWYGKGRTLAAIHLTPFFQGTQSENYFQVPFSVINEYVDSNVSKGINDGVARGSVNFGVKLMVWIRFKSGILRWKDHVLSVDCDPLSFSFSPNNNATGTLMGPPKLCAF